MRFALLLIAIIPVASACGARSTPPTPLQVAPCPLDLGRKHARRIGPTERNACGSACRSGDRGACVTYAIALEDGRGGPKDVEQATRIARRLCDQDYGPGCTHLAVAGRGDDQPEGLALVQKGCALKDPAGCIHLGWMYEHGEAGLAVDAARSSALYLQACEMGEPIGCVNAAWLHDVDGPLEPKDPSRALAVYAKACDEDAAVGCNNLAHHLLEGTLPPADPKRALALFERACADDYMPACMNLAAELSEGTHTPKDPVRAKQLWKLACDEGLGDACAEL
jgi:TPR repeat protein